MNIKQYVWTQHKTICMKLKIKQYVWTQHKTICLNSTDLCAQPRAIAKDEVGQKINQGRQWYITAPTFPSPNQVHSCDNLTARETHVIDARQLVTLSVRPPDAFLYVQKTKKSISLSLCFSGKVECTESLRTAFKTRDYVMKERMGIRLTIYTERRQMKVSRAIASSSGVN